MATTKNQSLNKLAGYRLRVEKNLENFFSSLREFDKFKSPYIREAFDMLQEFNNRPAKRVRSSMAIFIYEAYGGKKQAGIDKMAAAIELVQNSFLIVDDVMDKSSTRRSGPTLHLLYRELLKENKIPDYKHLGDMLAISVGVLAGKFSKQIISSIDEIDPNLVLRASHLFDINTTRTALGQIEDLHNNKYNLLSEKEILEILTNKSAYYTFVSPLQAGAALAGVSVKELRQLEKFGIPSGLMFQLRDDVLGLFGDEKKTGKSNTDDVREGKITLMIRHVLDNAPENVRNFILGTLGNSEVSVEDIEKLRGHIREYGSLDYVDRLSQKYIEEAMVELSELSISDKDKEFLASFLKYIAERHR